MVIGREDALRDLKAHLGKASVALGLVFRCLACGRFRVRRAFASGRMLVMLP